jgi:hypothetical protein
MHPAKTNRRKKAKEIEREPNRFLPPPSQSVHAKEEEEMNDPKEGHPPTSSQTPPKT